MWQVSNSADPGDAAADLGLHFLHMSEGPFSHDAGQMADAEVHFRITYHTIFSDNTSSA